MKTGRMTMGVMVDLKMVDMMMGEMITNNNDRYDNKYFYCLLS